MDNVTIPPEVVEAAAIADFKAWREYHNRTEEWGDLLPEEQESYRVAARAAIVAALAAWPWASEYSFSDNRGTFPALILTLPQKETGND